MRIVVTDLTRFTNASEDICLAGIDPESGVTVRPMISSGTKNSYLSLAWAKLNHIIPGSILEGDFRPVVNATKPHSEDHIVHGNIQVIGAATSDEFEEVLEKGATLTVREGFGTRPENRLFEPNHYPEKSIITLKLSSPSSQFTLILDENYGKKKFKAHVTDGENFKISWLPVTDLGLFLHLNEIISSDPNLKDLNQFLHNQKTIYLRIGLARPWSKSTESPIGCWVQLNGIYSFPNFRTSFRTYA